MYEHGKGRKIGLKVVLDTNVYVSIFNWPASPLAELWWHAQKGTYELFVSLVIVDELGATLRKEFFWGNADIVYHLKLVTSVGKLVVPKIVPDVVKEDPPDNHILACAVAAKAHLIVTRDLDLLRRKRYEGIGIVTPIDFLHMLEEGVTTP
jgi:putative PIN family toxin of toxin-antitoxin system